MIDVEAQQKQKVDDLEMSQIRTAHNYESKHKLKTASTLVLIIQESKHNSLAVRAAEGQQGESKDEDLEGVEQNVVVTRNKKLIFAVNNTTKI